MNKKKIILAGGTGFIGQEMIRYFGQANELVVLSRQIEGAQNNRNKHSFLTAAEQQNVRYVKWDGKTAGEWYKELNKADIVINLAGKTVNCRYTQKNKDEILNSRIDAVKAIGNAIQRCDQPPALWMNASSATIYRHATDKPQDEYRGEYTDGFSVQVCQQWEKTFFDQPLSSTRKVALRMAITLGAGGVLIPYFNLLKFGLGGKQGSGKQMFSWIHVEDICRMIEWIDHTKELSGVYNCSSPNPVTNKTFMKTLRKLTGTRFGLPAYTWMLKCGAAMIGTETELILKSRWVIPVKMLESGFVFKYPDLSDALSAILKQVPRKQYQLF